MKKQSQLFSTFPSPQQSPVVSTPTSSPTPSSSISSNPVAANNLQSQTPLFTSISPNNQQTSKSPVQPSKKSNPAATPTRINHAVKLKSVKEMQLSLLDLARFISNSSVYKVIYSGGQSPLLEEIEINIDKNLLTNIVSSVRLDKTGNPDGIWGNKTNQALKSVVSLGAAVLSYANRHQIKLNYFNSTDLNALSTLANTPPSQVNDEVANQATQLINEFHNFLIEMERFIVPNTPQKSTSIDKKDELTKDFDSDPNNQSLSQQIPQIFVEINGQSHPVTYNNIKNLTSFVAFVKQYYPSDKEIAYDHIYKAMKDISDAINNGIATGGSGSIYRVSPI